MTRNLLSVGAAVALVIGGPIAAEAQGRFNGLDRNRDGVVARAEWQGTDTSFRNQDRNGDGVLSGAELRRGSTAIVPVWWGYDGNRDGRVSRNEWPGVLADFDLLDTNDDGWLSRQEVNNARAVHQRNRGTSVGTAGRTPAATTVKAKPAPKAKPVKSAKAKPAPKAKPVKPAKPGRGRGGA